MIFIKLLVKYLSNIHFKFSAYTCTALDGHVSAVALYNVPSPYTIFMSTPQTKYLHFPKFVNETKILSIRIRSGFKGGWCAMPPPPPGIFNIYPIWTSDF